MSIYSRSSLRAFLSVCMSTSAFLLCLPVCPFVCLSVYLSVCLPVCLFIYLSVCLSICLSVCWFYISRQLIQMSVPAKNILHIQPWRLKFQRWVPANVPPQFRTSSTKVPQMTDGDRCVSFDNRWRPDLGQNFEKNPNNNRTTTDAIVALVT